VNIHEYLNYPMGKGAAYLMIGEAKKRMSEKFALDESEIKYVLYDTGRTLVFHFEMPSHSTHGLMYDVIVEFPYSKGDLNKGNSLYEFPFKVYSNCPSFVYTYAYVFYQKDLICNWLLDRYDKKTLTTPPKTRNEFGIVFYERSIFFALYYIRKNINQSLDLLTNSAQKASYSTIKARVNSHTAIKKETKIKKEEAKIEKIAQNALRNTPVGQASDVLNGLTAKRPNNVKAIAKAVKAKKPRGTTKPTRPH